jgi:hypothetical protein
MQHHVDSNRNCSQLIEGRIDSAFQRWDLVGTVGGQVCFHPFEVTVDNMRKAVFGSVVNVFLGLCQILGQRTALHGQISTATVSGTVADN